MEWANINNLKISSNEISLSGFKKFGCIGSLGFINFDKLFKFNMMFKYTEMPMNNFAIFDMDFAHNPKHHLFASLICQNENLIFYIKNNDIELKVWEGCPIEDLEWHDLQLIVDQKTISFYIDNKLISSYEFDVSISPCELFVGGNSDDILSNQNHSISMHVKDISLEIDSTVFPLIIENLKPLKDKSKDKINKIAIFFKKLTEGNKSKE